MVGRIPVMDVMPLVDLGRLPAKATAGESVPVRATVFREGHDRLGAEVVLVAPDGTRRPPVRMVATATPRPLRRLGHPRHRGRLVVRGARLVRPAGHLGARCRAQDPCRCRRRADVHRGRAAARPGRRCPDLDPREQEIVEGGPLRSDRRLAAGRGAPRRPQSPELLAVLAAHPVRDLVTVEGPYPLYADRQRALFARWYEFFPRRRARRTTRRPGSRSAVRSGPPPAARRRRRDGLRRGLPPADPPDRRGQPQGPEQHPRRRARTIPARRGRSAARTAATTPSSPSSARSPTSTRSWRAPASSASRWRSTSPCSARPTTPG